MVFGVSNDCKERNSTGECADLQSLPNPIFPRCLTSYQAAASQNLQKPEGLCDTFSAILPKRLPMTKLGKAEYW